MKRVLSMLLIMGLLISGCGQKTQTAMQESISNNESSAAEEIVSVQESQTEPEETHQESVKEQPDEKKSGTTVVDNRKKKSESAQNITAAFTEADFETTEYLYDDGHNTRYYIAIKNNSDAVVSISVAGQAIDTSGNILGADDCRLDVLGPGEESLTYLYFNGMSDVDHVDYSLNYSAENRYKPVVGNIEMSQTINDQNLTIVATNNGPYNAQFVEAYALFMDAGNNIVRVDSTYVTDGDSEIKPGATLSAQLNCRDDFDHVLCYLTGRSDGSVSEVSTDVSAEDFDIRECSYIRSGTTMYYLIVKNNSEKDVAINFNGTGYDADDNVIAADDCSIDILGVGEESITYFCFEHADSIARVEYQMAFDTDPYYKPVISNLSVEQNINDDNVVLVVTNNGEYPAEFVEAHALFFDAEGNIVKTDSSYITDDDSELKPGATLSAQLDCRGGFDTVECFYTGRYSK